MSKQLLNKIKNNGELFVFIFFFLLFIFRLFIGFPIEKPNNQNFKDKIEEIKNSLNQTEKSFKTSNIKKGRNHIGFIHYFIWISMTFIIIIFCFLTIQKNYIRHGYFEEQEVEYFFRTIHSSNLETNDQSFSKDLFI